MYKYLLEWLEQGEKLFDKYYQEALQYYIDSHEDFEYIDHWFMDSFGEDELLFNVYIEDIDIRNNMLYKYLTPKGKEIYNRYIEEHFNNSLDDYNFLNRLQLDNYGLVKIWRSITLNNEWDYQAIINHGGLGIYWSWDKSGAVPHGTSLRYNEFIISALVRPEDIEWVSTIFKNAYNLRDELEIEVMSGAPIKIYEIYTRKDGKLVLFNTDIFMSKC